MFAFNDLRQQQKLTHLCRKGFNIEKLHVKPKIYIGSRHQLQLLELAPFISAFSFSAEGKSYLITAILDSLKFSRSRPKGILGNSVIPTVWQVCVF